MLRIGDAAKKFQVSNRTLRYWEEKGILTSIRTENGYRYYDEQNAMRIHQIFLLRRLKVSLADIEQIFASDSVEETVHILTRHLMDLKQAISLNGSLVVLVEKLIRLVQGGANTEQVYLYLKEQDTSLFPEHEDALQILFSERIFTMPENQLKNVRIVRLPAMTVASYRAQSETPEADCMKVFGEFVLKNKLHERSGYRQFGFNNPSPSEGNPVYGYEMWVTIPDDYDVPAPLEKKHIPGTLYASISTNMNEIGERWQMLYEWCKNSDRYEPDFSFQWLEECSMDFETFVSEQVDDSEKQLDLLEPIREIK